MVAMLSLKKLCGAIPRQRKSQLGRSRQIFPSLLYIGSGWCDSDEAPSSHVLVAAFPECLVCLSPHLDLGQSSGCWTRDELAVEGGLSLAPKSCWSAICVRVEADVPTRNCYGRQGCQFLHPASCNDEKCQKKLIKYCLIYFHWEDVNAVIVILFSIIPYAFSGGG